MTQAFVALGSNLEDPIKQVQTACLELGHLAQTQLIATSSLYRSTPIGYLAQPDFINAVAQLDTQLEADALHQALLAIEARAGRTRSFRYAPRILDLDLLCYQGVTLHSESLILPHPRLHQRAFVLLPLHEIAPHLMIQGLGCVADLVQQLSVNERSSVVKTRLRDNR